MLLGQVFERFIQESPVSVMIRGLLEKALCPMRLIFSLILSTTVVYHYHKQAQAP
ncbi:MAG: hypothetical protein CLLPBCKN_008416 [Chroococcidiopsis cubana SAG 39.79]|nr:hypothetical protein [Chroococcidiopsis cubana SAG 39.79]MDZ4877183.1 hypothetical protein [Chroococcidiopsis cubana SAG 39.79]MDZ4878978.1 hypothetical protein [Chroococcidiopsis cubana SAG 39.79]